MILDHTHTQLQHMYQTSAHTYSQLHSLEHSLLCDQSKISAVITSLSQHTELSGRQKTAACASHLKNDMLKPSRESFDRQNYNMFHSQTVYQYSGYNNGTKICPCDHITEYIYIYHTNLKGHSKYSAITSQSVFGNFGKHSLRPFYANLVLRNDKLLRQEDKLLICALYSSYLSVS